jgi:osmoprotectant transport system ATP-binding protein
LNSSNTAQAEGPSSHPQAATLEFREVTKVYPGSGEPAIRALSFVVPAGDICVLVGPSGCGKTTAMRLVNRMIELTSGDILLDGRSVHERRPADLRRDIGYAIQQIGLFPHQSIGENIATVPRLKGWDRARIRRRVDELLELIGLDADMRDRYPAQLSGGQRQRVGVARALAADPPLMLMDEPFGAIDPINRDRLQNEFLRLQREIRKTVVFVTHDIDEAIKMGDRIAVLKKGGVLAQYGPPDELLLRPADAFVEDFVGADRALKHLSLHRVTDAALDPGPADASPDLPAVRRSDSLRDALSAILAAGVDRALVTDDGVEPTALLTIEAIWALTRAEEGLPGEAGARER